MHVDHLMDEQNLGEECESCPIDKSSCSEFASIYHKRTGFNIQHG